MHESNPCDIEVMRHSCAHLMAAAIQSLWPEAVFGVGPATDDGFYYDVRLPEPIGEGDLVRIEARMRELKGATLRFERSEHAIGAAIEQMRANGQPYKVELLELLRDRGSTAVAREGGDAGVVPQHAGAAPVDTVSFYRMGNFVDLCRGPHVDDSGAVGAFRLVTVSGAYWRGDVARDQLQRVSGLCFSSEAELEHALWQREEVKRRDHRRLGAAHGIFHFSPDVGPGLPLWLPHGTALRDELEFLARQEERREGYQRVSTPVIAREALYYRSRHLPYYAHDMYAPFEIEGERYYLRPMNCPHHHQVYLSQKRSYRDLPLRLTEYGEVYRFEASGALLGLMRTRGFCQNDAHIYCTRDQAVDEFVRVMRLHERYYALFGIRDVHIELALPDLERLDKYVDQPEEWLAAVEVIRAALEESGSPYVEAEGEAAFYGPKVDFVIRSAVGTAYAISTNQVDFLASQTFDLTYTGRDGEQHPVYVIHRAPLGSHERFVAFLLEHYGGRFPTWLAPVQVRVIPIAERHHEYARDVQRALEAVEIANGSGGLRVDVDTAGERMQKKVRDAQLDQVPYMVVVGDREQTQHTVAVRLRDGTDLGSLALGDLISRLEPEVRERRH